MYNTTYNLVELMQEALAEDTCSLCNHVLLVPVCQYQSLNLMIQNTSNLYDQSRLSVANPLRARALLQLQSRTEFISSMWMGIWMAIWMGMRTKFKKKKKKGGMHSGKSGGKGRNS